MARHGGMSYSEAWELSLPVFTAYYDEVLRQFEEEERVVRGH